MKVSNLAGPFNDNFIGMNTWKNLAQTGALGPPIVAEDRKMLIERGTPVEAGFLLAQGAAEIFQTSPSGTSVLVKLVTGPTILSSPEMAGGEKHHLATIRSAGTSTVYRIEPSNYFRIITENRQACFESLRDISSAFCGAARCESSRLVETEALLANLLLAYASVFGVAEERQSYRIGLRRSQSDLASAVGGSERSINRIMSAWKDEKLVEKRKGQYILYRPEILAAIAGVLSGALVHRWQPPVARLDAGGQNPEPFH